MAKRVVNESLITKIKKCQTFAELASLKSQYVVVGAEEVGQLSRDFLDQ